MKSTSTLLLFSLMLLIGCGDFTGNNLEHSNTDNLGNNAGEILISQTALINQGEFTLEKLIANTAVFVMQPMVERVQEDIAVLSNNIDLHCNFLQATDSISLEQLNTMRTPIQESWKQAMFSLHKLEMMNFGPTKEPSSTTMDSIYSFDGELKCRVDLSLLQLSSRDRLPRLDVINNYNVRGLDALEPLFFANPMHSRCKSSNSRLKTWFAKELLAKEKDICRYSQHLMTDMTQKVDTLADEWHARHGNYPIKLLAGKLGTALETINTISQSLFFLDTDIKDKRVAYPAGYDVRINETITSCPTEVCPDNTETPYAKIGLQTLAASIQGFQFLFNGINPETMKDGFGIDDLLIQRGHAQLATEIKSAIDQALKNINSAAKDKSFQDLLVNYNKEQCETTTSKDRNVEICAIVEDIRVITNLLKNEYLLVLQELRAPRNAQGDND